jgi:hypothetical protein
MAKVLVSDPVAAEGVAILRRGGLEVDVRTGLTKDELIQIIGDYDALAVRSETKVTADVLAAANKLKIIGRAGVGVDNIDVERATSAGFSWSTRLREHHRRRRADRGAAAVPVPEHPQASASMRAGSGSARSTSGWRCTARRRAWWGWARSDGRSPGASSPLR